MAVTEPGFSSSEVLRLAGCTWRQLCYWHRSGIVAPSVAGGGHYEHRRWSALDVARIRLVTLFGGGAGLMKGNSRARERVVELLGALRVTDRVGTEVVVAGEGVEAATIDRRDLPRVLADARGTVTVVKVAALVPEVLRVSSGHDEEGV